MAKKNIYVLDTNVYLTNAKAIYDYGIHDIVVPMKVLEEIDKHKNRQDSVGSQARSTIRTLDSLRERGNLKAGVRIAKGRGICRVAESDTSLLPVDLSPDVPDNMILSTALSVQKEEDAASNFEATGAKKTKKKVILVTRDINMRVICDAIGFPVETYEPESAVEDSDLLYSGYSEVLVDDEFIDRFYQGSVSELPEGTLKHAPQPNEFLMLVAKGNDKKTALARYKQGGDIVRVGDRNELFGIRSRNREQSFALDLLVDDNIKIITLVGKAGSGKTLCAIAAGLSQSLEKDTPYKKLIVSRPIQPMGKDIGYLPGDINEKMLPWLAPIQDNLQFLLGDDKEMLAEYIKKGKIELEALTYIRGRSISNAFIIIDEAQNLTIHELKTIITRVGENTKIVLTGDIEQIDNAFVNDVTNGLTHAVEKFKFSDLAGHVSLIKGERSKVATLAAACL